MDKEQLEHWIDLRRFESRLGLPAGFYLNLLTEDDWSFIIKLNALFEAACTNILATRLAPELEESLAPLDLARPKCGKIALLAQLKAITREQAKILRHLAELRNSVVHNISNIAFDLSAHVAQLNRDQSKQFVIDFGHGIDGLCQIGGHTVPRSTFVEDNPKLSIWLTASEILVCLYLEVQVADLENQRRGLDALTDYLKLKP